MSTLSDYLNAQLPLGWQKPQLVDALTGKLDRATVYKYLAGNHPKNPHDSVLAAFASVLPNASVVQLRAAANQPAGVEEPWIPPAEANRLTHAQRRALEALIKTMVLPGLMPADPAEGSERVLFAAVPAVVDSEYRTGDMAAENIDFEVAATEPSSQELLAYRSYLQQLQSAGRADLADEVAEKLAHGPVIRTSN
ncbi:MAG: hypothetical protein ACR2N4_19150 [Jatrophihabitans sp.]